MNRKLLKRTLALKPIVFAKPSDRNLCDLLIEAVGACKVVGDRLFHDEIIGDAGKEILQSYFYNNLVCYENGAVFFELWSYVPGKVPAGFIPDPKAINAQYNIAPMLDENGKSKEMISISHVLLFKNVAVIEATKGTGGAFLVEKYLNKLLRARCAVRPPHVGFETAMSSDLYQEIEQGGGVVSVSLGLASAQQDPGNKVSGLLSDAHGIFSRTELVTLSWTAEKKSLLDPEEVISEARVAKDDELDKIFIKLKHGSINGLSKYKITCPIEVKDVGGKNPDHKQVQESMAAYLLKLMTPNAKGHRVIDAEGNLTKNG